MMPDTDDNPSKDPLFDFPILARTLAATLQREREAAFVLGLHGPWGSGKTTLLNAIGARLPKAAIKVEFNAWKYQDREALWRALILRVLVALRERGGDAAKIDELERSLYEGFTAAERGPLRVNWTAAAASAIQVIIGVASAGAGGLWATVAGGLAKLFGQKKDGEGKAEDTAKQIERVAGILQRPIINRAVQHVVSIEQFVKLFREIVEQLDEKQRVYVLIDDLDRCLPESALGIFEAVKLFLDAPECSYVVAVDRAVIRRGLELRYPARSLSEARALPPVVDPDEYIEKTITLSVDLPMLADADGRALLAVTDIEIPLTPDEMRDIVTVLGTNPRRLKRFGAMLALWREVAQALNQGGQPPAFSPLDKANRPLFIKLSLIGYLNSALLAEMRRDPGLPLRLQHAFDAAFDSGQPKPNAIELIRTRVKDELPVIAQAALDPALWRAFRLAPSVDDVAGRIPRALRWFRAGAG